VSTKLVLSDMIDLGFSEDFVHSIDKLYLSGEGEPVFLESLWTSSI
jgi:hypothetical protein